MVVVSDVNIKVIDRDPQLGEVNYKGQWSGSQVKATIRFPKRNITIEIIADSIFDVLDYLQGDVLYKLVRDKMGEAFSGIAKPRPE